MRNIFMEIFHIISKWFWALCIVVTFLNAAVFYFRAKTQIKQTPGLEAGYREIIRGFVIWGNVPWVVMGIGCTVGGVPSVWHYFNPEAGNPYVLAFFAAVVLVWIKGSYWILFQGGAQAIVDHPGIFNFDISSPILLKMLWIATIVAGVTGIFFMVTQNIPLPSF